MQRERRALAGEKRETTRSRASSDERRFRVLLLKKPCCQVENKKRRKRRRRRRITVAAEVSERIPSRHGCLDVASMFSSPDRRCFSPLQRNSPSCGD
ncbi:hypothetical protein PUN28_008952 [Cardiocondyla obscurior]|uniref:Uncharacterized protein n=1 Tax=Cardiocondyla obscurior TaxID=286306 RepID=A0AAW2FS36_9HYME